MTPDDPEGFTGEEPKKHFRVHWLIDLSAIDAIDAAKQAKAAMQDPQHIALILKVVDKEDGAVNFVNMDFYPPVVWPVKP